MAVTSEYGALLDALRGVLWPARLPSRAASAGTHKSRLRGSSAEFTEYRAYRQGDDPRRLDWKLLAKTDRAWLRITNERATLPTLLLVDGSLSMRFPEGERTKWDAARALAVGLAGVAHSAGDPVAVAVPGQPPRRLPLRARRGVVSDVARMVDGVTPDGSAPLAPMLRDERRAARLVILTDLLGDASALLRAAKEQMSRGAEVVLVHLVARQELDPPAGARLALDPEDPALHRPLTGTTREGYRAAFDAWRASEAAVWRSAGARVIEVVTDEPAERAVRRITGTQREGVDA